MPRRRALLAVGVAVLLAAGAFATWRYVTHQPPGWLTRWRVQRYLKKEAHTGNFKVESFAFPSKAEMAKAAPKSVADVPIPKGRRTGKDFDALREEYFPLKSAALVLERGLIRSGAELKESAAELDALTKQLADAPTAGATNVAELEAKAATLRTRVAELGRKVASRSELNARETALEPIVSDLWEFQREWIGEAGDAASGAQFAKSRAQFTAELRQKFEKASSYADMYKLIGQELWVAGRLLDSANPEYVRSGMSLALNASQHALNEAQNGWVAARICEGYVLPHLDAADDANRRSQFNRDNLLNECAGIFRRNNEYDAVVRTYKTALAAAGTPQKADSARAQIARAYADAGDVKQALRYIRAIQDTNDYRFLMRQVPRMEQQLKAN